MEGSGKPPASAGPLWSNTGGGGGEANSHELQRRRRRRRKICDVDAEREVEKVKRSRNVRGMLGMEKFSSGWENEGDMRLSKTPF